VDNQARFVGVKIESPKALLALLPISSEQKKSYGRLIALGEGLNCLLVELVGACPDLSQQVSARAVEASPFTAKT
jgi:hypothetical protein